MYVKALLKLIFAFVSGNKFFTYRLYPKRLSSNSYREECLSVGENSKIAIVVQGPFIEEDSFTLETLRLYRYNFPYSVIILSTWVIPEGAASILAENRVQVILNDRPKNSGIANVNLQIVTSRAGMLLARKLGAEYALKTRTDQRIYHTRLDAYLLNLVDTFPLVDGYPKQHSRLVACSLNTFKLRPYGISDMFLFGHIDDMVRYWCVHLDNRENTDIDKKGCNTPRGHALAEMCEVYFCVNFLRGIGRQVLFSLESSLRTFADHFIIIDQSAIKLYWNKYMLDEERYKEHGFFDPTLSFNDWLMLYKRIDSMSFNEKMLDEPISVRK